MEQNKKQDIPQRPTKTDDTEKIIRVGITQGDFNGIGFEIIIKTLADARIFDNCTPVVYGSSKVASYHKKVIDAPDFNFNTIRDISEAHPNRANLVNCLDREVKIDLGQSTAVAGEFSLKSIEAAIKDLKSDKLDVLVTAPINKYNIQSDSFHFPGHTEYLADAFGAKNYLMLLVSNNLRVGVVTGHIPLKDVSSVITKELIYSKIKVLNESLIKDFTISRPRIAVLALNPHAGDNCLIGNEEKDAITPAIAKAAAEKINVFGPYPADGFFGSCNYKKFDAILAMYHDQGLVPFKALSFETGVNYTAGLPIIRTSPNHGTGYDIAGKNEANPSSFRAAMYLAIDIYNNRKMYKEITANPLKSYEKEKVDSSLQDLSDGHAA